VPHRPSWAKHHRGAGSGPGLAAAKEGSKRGEPPFWLDKRSNLLDKAKIYPAFPLRGQAASRVAIVARTGVGSKVMLFDEPTSALGPRKLTGEVLKVIRASARDVRGPAHSIIVDHGSLVSAREGRDKKSCSWIGKSSRERGSPARLSSGQHRRTDRKHRAHSAAESMKGERGPGTTNGLGVSGPASTAPAC